MSHPVYTPQEALTRESFLALMWALSHPGHKQKLPSSELIEQPGIFGACLKIGATLLDLETSYFTPDDALAEQLKRTTARALPAERAAYHFYPMLTGDGLTFVELAGVGTAQYPDQAATLIIGCTFEGDALANFTLSGPGINGQTGQNRLRVGGLPDAFWALRRLAARFPLGWDVFLVDAAGQVVGLPRSTRIERATEGQEG